MRVLAIDVGFMMGYGVLGPRYVRSGEHRLRGSSAEMGEAFRSLRERVLQLVETHKPTAIACAAPFVGKMANPINMRPIFGFSCRLQEIADEAALQFGFYYESDARRAFLGSVPRKSEHIKDAVIAACRMRGWPVTDNHAADALCIADFAMSRLNPSRAHETTPLFSDRAKWKQRRRQS